MSRPHEDLLYTIEEWALDDSRCTEVLARVHLMSVAWSAYWACVAARPKSRIVLRKQAWELAAHRPRTAGYSEPHATAARPGRPRSRDPAGGRAGGPSLFVTIAASSWRRSLGKAKDISGGQPVAKHIASPRDSDRPYRGLHVGGVGRLDIRRR